MTFFTQCETPVGVSLIKVGPSNTGMDEVDILDLETQRLRLIARQEALVVESYEAFIKIKEEHDPGTFPLIFSLLFLILIPIFSIQDSIMNNGSTSCFWSILIGLALLGVGAIQSAAQWSRYNKATKDLAHVAGIPKKIAYPFFSLQAADKRITSLVLQKSPFLSESIENSTKTKPQKIVFSQSEEEWFSDVSLG